MYKVKHLHAQLLAWRQELRAPMPTKNTGIGNSGKKSRRNTQKLSVEDESE
jgi:hypothetical protein